jgi:putative transposase
VFSDLLISSFYCLRRIVMSKPLHPLALFRLCVLGPLASRGQLKHGEVKAIIRELAAKTYDIPDSRRIHLSEETILRWYYDWKKGGIEALVPQSRSDRGKTQLSKEVQTALIQIKKENSARSINTLIGLLEAQGIAAKGKLSRATVHRFLQQQQLSRRMVADIHTIERRSFLAEHCGDIWYGDVLHGPSIQTEQGMKKTYLVSLMDDASRFIVHSAFCLGETALDIESVLKQAVLKRGLPHKLVIDNGPAYRAGTLRDICAILEIRLIYCRPYEPEGKGKLERFHRTFRGQFLSEINLEKVANLYDLNARLWAWLDQIYHQRPHGGLQGKTPQDAWRDGILQVRSLGFKGAKIDDIFCHRVERTIRKDGTLSWEGRYFETAFELADKKVVLVIDPHTQTALRVESIFGDALGPVTPLDKISNLNRKRQRPSAVTESKSKSEKNSVELAFAEQSRLFNIPLSKNSSNQ